MGIVSSSGHANAFRTWPERNGRLMFGEKAGLPSWPKVNLRHKDTPVDTLDALDIMGRILKLRMREDPRLTKVAFTRLLFRAQPTDLDHTILGNEKLPVKDEKDQAHQKQNKLIDDSDRALQRYRLFNRSGLLGKKIAAVVLSFLATDKWGVPTGNFWIEPFRVKDLRHPAKRLYSLAQNADNKLQTEILSEFIPAMVKQGEPGIEALLEIERQGLKGLALWNEYKKTGHSPEIMTNRYRNNTSG